MARCAILLALIGICITAPAFARDIEGYETEHAKWLLRSDMDATSRWGFMDLDFGWESWDIWYDPLRVVELEEMQNPEDPDPVTVKTECVLMFAGGKLEMVLFDIADDELSYRRLARIFNDYYDDEDNELVVDKWNHRVWTDRHGDTAILVRYLDERADIRTRLAYMTPEMAELVTGEEKPEWFTALLKSIEKRR